MTKPFGPAEAVQSDTAMGRGPLKHNQNHSRETMETLSSRLIHRAPTFQAVIEDSSNSAEVQTYVCRYHIAPLLMLRRCRSSGTRRAASNHRAENQFYHENNIETLKRIHNLIPEALCYIERSPLVVEKGPSKS